MKYIVLLIFGLIILKLSGAVTISWLWVFSPLWLPFVLVIGTFGIVAVVGIFTVLFLWVFYAND